MSNIPHDQRRFFVGASEVAALFGLHPQITKFELWHIKAGNVPAADLSDNDRVFWGNTLEPAVAVGVAELKGWRARKVRRYIKHPSVEGMGASLDYEVIGDSRGAGVLEIKTVDWLEFRHWPEGEPPVHYQLQLQHQLAVTGRAWGAVGVLIGGNRLEVFEFDRHPGAIARIEAAVREFWQSIAINQPPKPDFQADLATITQLYADASGEPADMHEDNYLASLCADYAAAADQERQASKAKDAAKAEILTKIGSAPRVLAAGFTISAGEVPGGRIEYDRKPYRAFRITPRKDKADDQHRVDH